jgi:hypothetical protein
MLRDQAGEIEKATIRPLSIIGPYDIQRFKQFSPQDTANWYITPGQSTKRPQSMYPTMGRRHINFLGVNRLIFPAEPRGFFKTIDFWYSVVGNSIYRVDKFFNQIEISEGKLLSTSGNVFFTYLVVNSLVFACFVDDQKIYVYQENTGTFDVVTDPNAPGNFTVNGIQTKPGYIAAFGNRITVSVANSSQFVLSAINLLTGTPAVFNPATCFTINGAQVFAQENGKIRQMAVLHNTLYIFTDYTTGIWQNTPAIFSGTGVSFPWKKNSTYDWNYGIADPLSLDVNFGRMAFLGKNSEGLLQVMASNGDKPIRISTKAVDVMIQDYTNKFANDSPFLNGKSDGFLYQYENTIFYRISGGKYTNAGILDQEINNNSIEYNFESQEWHRCIELNGERSRVQKHIFFDTRHLVTVLDEGTVYEFSGSFYTNEVRNNDAEDPQDVDAYIQFPFRYERTTPIISEEDYSEFETEYVEIDFVFGDSNINFSSAPFANTQFIIDEVGDADGNPIYIIDEVNDSDNQPVFMITEEGNTPGISEKTYNAIYKPHVELYWSDDGGISFFPADVREFSQMGVYQWRMRWYQLGVSRNRVYKLICVSPIPIVVLGGVMNTRRVGGGAN